MDVRSLVIEVLTALLVPFFTILAYQLIAWLNQFLKSRGLALTAEQQAQLEAAAKQAILAAEEWAHAQAKVGITTTGDVKMAMAKSFMAEAIPSVQPSVAEVVINAQLATARREEDCK